MQRRFLIAAFMLVTSGAGVAFAEDDDCHVPMALWQPRTAVLALAEVNEWQVFRIKTYDGCYQIRALDAQGRSIEVTLDPSTLETINLEFEGLDDDDEGHGSSDDHGNGSSETETETEGHDD